MIKEYETNGHNDELYNFAYKLNELWKQPDYFEITEYKFRTGMARGGDIFIKGDGIELRFTFRGVRDSDPYIPNADPIRLRYLHKVIVTTPDNVDPDEVLIKLMLAV
jgi:hypothetical protein